MYAPKRRNDGLVVNLFKKRDEADLRNYREIMSFTVSTVGKSFSTTLNHGMGTVLQKDEKQANGRQRLGQTVAA